MQGGTLRSVLIAAAILPVVCVFAGAAALAAAPTHDQYVVQAERVCKSSSSPAFALLKNAKKNIQSDRAELGGHELLRASGIFESIGKRIRAIQKPPEDVEVLEEWTEKLDAENDVLRKAGKALSAGQKVKGQGYLTRFVHNAAAARDVVLGFGFNHCLFKNSTS